MKNLNEIKFYFVSNQSKMSFSEIKEIIQSINPNFKVIDASIPARDCRKFLELVLNKKEDTNLCLIVTRDEKNNAWIKFNENLSQDSRPKKLTHIIHHFGNMIGLTLDETINPNVLKLFVEGMLTGEVNDECPICMEPCNESNSCCYCSYCICIKCRRQIDRCPQCREYIG